MYKQRKLLALRHGPNEVKTRIFAFNFSFANLTLFRYTLNITAAGFVFIGTLCDIGTWYYSKDVQIFDKKEDEADEEEEIREIK
jgi:hypothetical protein